MEKGIGKWNRNRYVEIKYLSDNNLWNFRDSQELRKHCGAAGPVSRAYRINAQWRICFRWADDGPCDVEVVDYH